MDQEVYQFDEEIFVLIDAEVGISFKEYHSLWFLPSNPVEGQKVGATGYIRFLEAKPHLPCAVFIESEGMYHGERRLFHSNGQVKTQSFYTLGRLHGPCSCYHEEGGLLSEVWFIRGERQGKSLLYYRSGQLYAKLQYREGRQEGMQEYFYENGEIKTRSFYQKGELHGLTTLYLEDGRIERQVQFIMGRPDTSILLNGTSAGALLR